MTYFGKRMRRYYEKIKNAQFYLRTKKMECD